MSLREPEAIDSSGVAMCYSSLVQSLEVHMPVIPGASTGNTPWCREEADAWDQCVGAMVRLANVRRRLVEEGTLSGDEGAVMATKALIALHEALRPWSTSFRPRGR